MGTTIVFLKMAVVAACIYGIAIFTDCVSKSWEEYGFLDRLLLVVLLLFFIYAIFAVFVLM